MFKYWKTTVWNHYGFISNIDKSSFQHLCKIQNGNSDVKCLKFWWECQSLNQLPFVIHAHKSVIFFMLCSSCLSFSLCNHFVLEYLWKVKRIMSKTFMWRTGVFWWEDSENYNFCQNSALLCPGGFLQPHLGGWYWPVICGFRPKYLHYFWSKKKKKLLLVKNIYFCASHNPFWISMRLEALVAQVLGLLIALLFTRALGEVLTDCKLLW